MPECGHGGSGGVPALVAALAARPGQRLLVDRAQVTGRGQQKLRAAPGALRGLRAPPRCLDLRERRECKETGKNRGGEHEVHLGDARPFVRRAARTWDLVALDVVGSDLMPEHLVSLEWFREVSRVLSPGGVFAMNSG